MVKVKMWKVDIAQLTRKTREQRHFTILEVAADFHREIKS